MKRADERSPSGLASRDLFGLAVLCFVSGHVVAFFHFLSWARRIEAAGARVFPGDLMPMFRSVGWYVMCGIGSALACCVFAVRLHLQELRAEEQQEPVGVEGDEEVGTGQC